MIGIKRQRFTFGEVVVCAHIAINEGGEDVLGGIANAAKHFGRGEGSFRDKVQNCTAMLRGHGMKWNRKFSPLTGRASDGPIRTTDWNIVEIMTKLPMEDQLALCRYHLGQ